MRRLLAAVLLVSAAAIAYEILLMRMLSIVQWHHFAWMVISLALLGYGASGTAIALARERLAAHFETAFTASALAFSGSMAACWALAQRVPFNALEVVWAPRQLLYLAALYLLFMVPFFFAATCIGLAFTFRGRQAARVYRLDLLGAGCGAVAVIALLFALDVPAALAAVGLLAAAAALLTAPGPWLRAGAVAWAVVLAGALAGGLLDLRPSPFKSLSTALQTVGAEVVHESSSPLGRITVVDNRRVPLRHAPGLGLASPRMPPEQLAVFTDGEGPGAITRWDGRSPPPAYLGDLTSALPYQMLAPLSVGAASAATGGAVHDERPVGPEGPPTGRASVGAASAATGGPAHDDMPVGPEGPSAGTDLRATRVLVLGAGTGTDVLQALLHGAGAVDAVELDPAMIALVRDRFAAFAGGLYAHPRVRLHVAEARSFAARATDRYDLVQIGLLDGFAVSGSGVQALNENYLYTAEAVRDYLRLLRPGGLLAVTRWLRIPPRDSLKLVNTVVRALRQQGVEDPGAHLAAIRGWSTVTLLVANEPLGPDRAAAIRSFAARGGFDTIHYPGMPAAEANRYNRLERAWFHEGVTALLGPDAARWAARYKFDIEAATDERPYFFNFFRWRTFREALELRERGGAALVEWGYLVPAATLAQAALAGGLLILLPLALAGRSWPPGAGRRAGPYFFLLGLAFLFVEIAFIHKFTLFLGHPLYAVAVVLAGFLVFAGIGSGLSERLARRAAGRGRSAVRGAVAGIVALAALDLALLPSLFEWAGTFGAVGRIATAVAAIAPLAVCMGMPFPLGLARLAERAPGFIPWAWGINGFASVVSAALATLLAIEFGFTAVLLLALALYALAAWLAPDAAQPRAAPTVAQRL
jgi:SAM-dependent methyltransferase